MCVSQRREVPAGPGRDPAAQGRVLEGLREVAQGQAVLAQLLLEPRPARPGLDPRRQRARVDFDHPVEPAQVHRHHRRARRAAARPRRRRWCRRRTGPPPRPPPRPSSARSRSRPPRAGTRPGPAGSRTRPGTRARRPGRPSPARGRPARTSRRRRGPRTPLGRFSRERRSSTSSSGTGFSTSPPNPNRARIPSAASRSCVARRRLVLIPPPPMLQPPLTPSPKLTDRGSPDAGLRTAELAATGAAPPGGWPDETGRERSHAPPAGLSHRDRPRPAGRLPVDAFHQVRESDRLGRRRFVAPLLPLPFAACESGKSL